jgi:hypothetical protein
MRQIVVPAFEKQLANLRKELLRKGVTLEA